ncbi:MAG: hypothetical protein ACRDH8_11425 [Actinomycetota bacterium]
MRNAARTLIALTVGALVVLPAAPASAHEVREVGDYTFVVGWYDEPAFANAKNGPEVTITDARENPIEEGVELSIEITFEGESATYELEPAFSEPNNYQADLFPTRPGTYEFHVTGTVEGQEIDETFTSGPDTFSDIEDPGEVAFPVEDPAISELADQVEQVAGQVSAEDSATPDDVSSARTLGWVGIAVGALGLLVAIIALARRRTA